VSRIGLGFDAHAFDDHRPLVLGGVVIPGHAGLAGHSDADVVSHAIADALLGAAGLSDIGTMFPHDERWRGASSLDILAEVSQALAEASWSVGNVDATVIAESPRLGSHRSRMITVVAAALQMNPQDVWVKATTSDGLGFTGRGDGIAAIAAVLIERI
jgi:2-C-methyl-D-erythritol 2,4-cyclodiphosphate synthase